MLEGTRVEMRTLRRYSIRGYVIEMMAVSAFFELFAWVAIVSLSSLLGFSHTIRRFDRTET